MFKGLKTQRFKMVIPRTMGLREEKEVVLYMEFLYIGRHCYVLHDDSKIFPNCFYLLKKNLENKQR